MPKEYEVKIPRKLIEVALPLDSINEAAAREKSIRHGHPSTLHLWWARRPLAAARAVLFSQLVNDPGFEKHDGFQRGLRKEDAKRERARIFKIIEKLVRWENTTNDEVIEEARAEILRSWRETCELNKDHPNASTIFNPDILPPFHDPFAGGGAIPLEAMRLGLKAYASDLNPVAVLINKALIEVPQRFSNKAPVGPISPQNNNFHLSDEWIGLKGLAEDVRRYGTWMRNKAHERIGKYYSQITLPKEYGGEDATPIAWLWTRTAKCPNPACRATMPLLSSFTLSSVKGREAYLIPLTDSDGEIHFDISNSFPKILGDPSKGYKRGLSGIFECYKCHNICSRDYLADYASKHGLGSLPTAVVCETSNGRRYIPSKYIQQQQVPEIDKQGLTIDLSPNPRDVWCRNFGLLKPVDLFTPRQLLTLSTFSDLIIEMRDQIISDAIKSGFADDKYALDKGGCGAVAYAEAISVYLACALSKVANIGSTAASWMSDRGAFRETFARQALPMVWDYAEANPFSNSGGSISTAIEKGALAILTLPSLGIGQSDMVNATMQTISEGKIVSTDPPYYDNIGYADLSDFFYVWLRRTLRPIYPSIFATMAVPKEDELVALSYRHKNKNTAEKFFMEGMTDAMQRLVDQAHPAFPITIYYAFKQSSTNDSGTRNTGWETFLEAVIRSGFVISGTWPMRTEGSGRLIAKDTNALASSIVLVCRKRRRDAQVISRREFLKKLKDELSESLEVMIAGSSESSPVAPVDLAQAIIGPGMGIYSSYAAVLEADGSQMTVQNALSLINHAITESASGLDTDTQFCIDWFNELLWNNGEFGKADVLARAKGTSVEHVRSSGVIEAENGKVRLFRPLEYNNMNWDPAKDKNIPCWELLNRLSNELEHGGTERTGALLARVDANRVSFDAVRKLAYQMYTACERRGKAEDARLYNNLVIAWDDISQYANTKGRVGTQASLQFD